MMVPVGRMVVLRATPKDKLVHAIATLTWPALGAPVLGPVLGGFITMHWGWHWIFLLNVPFGLIGFLLTQRLVNGVPGGRRPFDTLGFILSGVGCSALMYACDLSAQSPFAGTQVAFASVLGMLALAWAVYHLRRTPHPLVDLEALRIPTFAVAMRGGALFRITINSAPFLMPLMFQLAFGFDATTAGMLLLALFAGNICMKPATTPLLRALGFRTVLLINGLMVALGFILCLWLSPQTPKPIIMLVLFFTGLSRSMQFTGLSTFSFCDISHDRMSGASTLSSILVQMSAGLGVALAAIALRVASIWFPAPEHTLSIATFQIAFVVMAVLSLAGLPDIYRLPTSAGGLVSGHRPSATRPA
jgi:MFS family permease